MQRLKLFSATVICAMMIMACGQTNTPPTAQMPSAATLSAAPLLFVNYWATWCGPCREEIPELNTFAREHGDALSVVAINFDGNSGDRLQKEIQEMGIAFASTDLQTGTQLGLAKPEVLPTTYVLQKGKLVNTLIGPQTLQDLQAIVTALDK